MEYRHPPIGYEPHENFAQIAQFSLVPLSQLQTTLHGPCCKAFKPANIDRDFPLEIPYADSWR
jgi:hypothetical protein